MSSSIFFSLPKPFCSSIHSSYDDLPELVQFAPPPPSQASAAAEVPSEIKSPIFSLAAEFQQPSLLSATAKDLSAMDSPTFCSPSDFSRPINVAGFSNNLPANTHAHIQLSSYSVKSDPTRQSDTWAQVAHHLASGKWPAPQVLPLIVWCLALFVLAF
jgi:hypothetical protein